MAEANPELQAQLASEPPPTQAADSPLDELRIWRDYTLGMWAELGDKENLIIDLERNTKRLEKRIQQLTAQIEEQQKVLDYYATSASWRITAPLRAVRKGKSRN